MLSRLHRLKTRALLSVLFVSSLVFCLWFSHAIHRNPVTAQEIAPAVDADSGANPQQTARDLVQQGVERYQAGHFQGAIAPWESALEYYQASGDVANQAIVLENLARAYRSLGNADRALPYWEQTAAVYEQLGDTQKVGRLLTEQAQTHANLGQYRQATGQLCGAIATSAIGGTIGEAEAASYIGSCDAGSAVGIARGVGDRPGEAAALGSLGEAYRLQGDYGLAIAALKESLAIAQEIDHTQFIAAATNGLGGVYTRLTQISDRRAGDAVERGDSSDARRLQDMGRADNEDALTYFQQSLAAAEAAADTRGQLQALLNLIPVYHRAGDLTATQISHGQAIALLDQMPASRITGYAALDLAHLLPLTQSLHATRASLSGITCLNAAVQSQAQGLYEKAVETAKQIGDFRAQSFALGKLGHLYECRQDYPTALELTQEAEWSADQDLRSRDSLYLWQWQTGRIFSKQVKQNEAIAAYEKAIDTLEKIRSDILIADRDIQFDFRDAVEPVYRELAALRLSQAPPSESIESFETGPSQNITSALTAIDSLKLAELQNYFGDECIILSSLDADETGEVATKALQSRDASVGIFSTFILEDRTAIILTLPGGRQRVEWLNVSQDELREEINQFRLGLEESLYSLLDYQTTLTESLYAKLIQPFAEDLSLAQVDTLIFVQDGIFRSVPMAALYDGTQYLIETYAIATTPSLSLINLDPPAQRRNLRALALGLSNSVTVEGEEFRPLRGVGEELRLIKDQLPGSRSFLNQDFTRDRLRQELQDNEYSIIHMATHGEFGAEPEDTFLVTGDGQRLTIGELENAIRSAGGTAQIDLLTLTACKTGIGDNRSALGLAGVAVQAGARSAIASLWAIDDVSTAEIMADFYQELSNIDLTKAQALQTAQIKAIQRGDRFARPGFWAPFILIGDWR